MQKTNNQNSLVPCKLLENLVTRKPFLRSYMGTLPYHALGDFFFISWFTDPPTQNFAF